MPSKNWGNQREAPTALSRESLEKLDMKALRELAHTKGLSAKDTSKQELIDEILKEVN